MPINLIIRNPLDRDAREFIGRAGVTDAAARAQLNAFVRGLKSLGVWQSVTCWPLRSSQNVGTGTNVLSLGGLGPYDGTFVNGPTWGAQGITFSATNRNIQIPDTADLRNALSGMFVFNSNDTALNQILATVNNFSLDGFYYRFTFSGQNFSGQEQGLKLTATRNGVLSTNFNSTRPINLNLWRSGTFTSDNSTDNVYENGVLTAGGARTGVAALNAIGSATQRHLFGQSVSMVGAFAMLSPSKWSDNVVSELSNLYKTTLGTGLGLP